MPLLVCANIYLIKNVLEGQILYVKSSSIEIPLNEFFNIKVTVAPQTNGVIKLP